MTVKTLTPVDIQVSIGGTTFSRNTSPVSVIGFRYSLKLNDIAEGTISLGIKNRAGIEAIRRIFPTQGSSATFFSEAIVTLSGASTSLSTIKQGGEIFRGTVVGYGQDNSAGGVSLEVNLKGSFFRLQQIPIMAPGLHPASPKVFAASTLVSGDNESQESNFVVRLQSAISGKSSGFEMFKAFADVYQTIVENATAGDAAKDQTLQAAIKAFGFDTNSSVVQQEIGNLIEAPGTSLNPTGDVDVQATIQAMQTYLGRAFESNPAGTWWDFLMMLMQTFALNIVSLGKSIVGLPKSPLDQPVDANIIEFQNVNNYQISDFPFFLPTRCVVTSNVNHVFASLKNKGWPLLGAFPSSGEATEQEKATGVLALFQDGPAFLGDLGVARNARKVAAEVDSMKWSASGQDVVKKQKELEKAELEAIGAVLAINNLYAQYLFMHNRFRQRGGQATLRYTPNLLPGLPGAFRDPFGVANFDFHLVEVRHSIDSIGEQAITQIVFDNVRYGGELDPNPFPNPLYSGFSTSSAASEMLNVLGVK